MEPTTDELLAEAIRLSLLDGSGSTTQQPEPPPEPQNGRASTDEEGERATAIVRQLVAMSYSEAAARHAVEASAGLTVDAALGVLHGDPSAAATGAAAGGGGGGSFAAPSPFQPPELGGGVGAAGGEALMGGAEEELTQTEIQQLYGMEGTVSTMQGAGEDALWRAKKLLDTLLGNILRQPSEPKYRKINTRNKKLAAELFSVPGARQLLLLAGFEPWYELCSEGSVLVLPMGADSTLSLEPLRKALSLLLTATETFSASRLDSGSRAEVFRCRGCKEVIDGRRNTSGPRASTWVSNKMGAFRYRCRQCEGGFDLCEECYDERTAAPLFHSAEHEFEIIGPDKPHMSGAPMPPPKGSEGGRFGRSG